jgi:signal transduction histidine kinase/streptogramin lyase
MQAFLDPKIDFSLIARPVSLSGRLSRLLLCVGVLLNGIHCAAQNNPVHVSQLAHKAWRLREGAIPSAANAIAQTKDGYIWVGTDDGLYRFDGETYERIGADSVPILNVVSLFVDREGSLWVGGSNDFYHLEGGGLRKRIGYQVEQMFQTTSGDIVAGVRSPTQPTAVCRIQKERVDCSEISDINHGAFNIVNDGRDGFWLSNHRNIKHRNADGGVGLGDSQFAWNGNITALGSDNHGRVWAGIHEAGRASRLFEKDALGWHALPELPGTRESTEIQTVFLDREGALWVGTSDAGIYRLIGNVIDRFDQSDGLSGNSVNDITQDSEGSVWVATSGGIDQLRRALVDSWSTREGLSADRVNAIVADGAGRIWMSNAGGLDVLENGEIHSYRPGKGLPGLAVAALASDHAGRLWVGIDLGLWILDNGKFQHVLGPNGKDIGQVILMREDSTGQMWIRAGSDGRQLYRSSQGKLQPVQWNAVFLITAFYPDPVDGMWIGVRNMPAFRVSSNATQIPPVQNPSWGDSFRSFFQTKGKLFSQTKKAIATTGHEDNSILSQRNGLDYESFFSSAVSLNGDVYLMTNKNYLRITADNFDHWTHDPTIRVASRVIDSSDGAFPGGAMFDFTSSVAPNGDIWFATGKFPQRIVPSRVSVMREPPSVKVESIFADGVTTDRSKGLILRAGTQTLDIHYAALSYLEPQNIRYRYLLEGYDTDWRNVGIQRQASFNHLPPGQYRFRVVASDVNGLWTSQEAQQEFKVLPRFYQTIWFEVILILIAVFSLWLLYLARLRHLIGKAKAQMFERISERERIARDLHDTFFQGIQGLLLRFQTGTSALPALEPVRPMFEDLLKQSDQVMREGRELVLDLRSHFSGDEDLAQAFASVCAELEAVFPTKYSVIVQGKTRPLQSRIGEEVFRIGKEAITNAFQHSEATTVEVEISFGDRDFKLHVRDNGCGIDPAIQETGTRAGHFGLTGMRERAKRIKAKLEIWSQIGAGTEIELSISAPNAFPATNRYFSWVSQLKDKQI